VVRQRVSEEHREMLEVDDWHGMDGTAGPAQ
jgi:hypothetical protein